MPRCVYGIVLPFSGLLQNEFVHVSRVTRSTKFPFGVVAAGELLADVALVDDRERRAELVVDDRVLVEAHATRGRSSAARCAWHV